MCVSGGGGGVKAAERAERERQQQVASGTRAIDQAFAGRQGQYGDFLSALQNFYRTQLSDQYTGAARQGRFSLARSGLTGGSAQTDLAGILGREQQQGALSAERRAQGALADLMGRDDATRMNLLSLVQGGADATTAAQSAANAMRANISGARSEGMVAGLGDVFGGTADLYRRQQEGAERRRGMQAGLYADPFSRRT